MEEQIKTEEEKTLPIIINDGDDVSVKRERPWDHFIWQLILTAAIVLVFLIINIFTSDTAKDFLSCFRKLTGEPPEEFIESIVHHAKGMFGR